MNAYELADQIDNFWNLDEQEMKQAANMLRQQADRLAELDKIVKNTIGQAFYEDDFHKAEATIARQLETVDKFAEENARLSNRIAELEKQLDETKLPAEFQKVLNDNLHELYETDEKQSEPVAWFDGEHYVCPEIGYEYTITTKHPKNLGWKALYTTPQTKPLSDEEIYDIGKQYLTQYEDGLIDFARAIEAKVRGEK